MLNLQRTIPLLSSRKTIDITPKYTNAVGKLDLGVFLEDLDIAGGDIAMQQAGMKVVTAAMQGAAIKKPLTLDMDYLLDMYVTKTWKTSLEIGIDVYGTDGREKKDLVSFFFTFVGIENGKPVPIIGDEPQTPLERERALHAEKKKEQYLESIKKPFTMDDLTQEEKALAAEFLTAKDAISVESTKQAITESMVVRNKNIHNIIFGGHIMNRTFDRAWHHAYEIVGSGRLPLAAAIDRVNFVSPVQIGDILRYDIRTVYSHKTSLVERVEVTAEDPLTGARRQTNVCTYTFVAVDRNENRIPVPRIIPTNEHDILLWIAADRKRMEYEAGKIIS